MTAIWEKCESCDDYICNIHMKHVFECECQDVEEWYDIGIDPYDYESLESFNEEKGG